MSWYYAGDMEHREWLMAGRRLGAIGRGSRWWIGDWLQYGAARWGESYVEASKITGYDPKTLRNIRYVASRFDLSLRRDNLTWSHHALVAGLEPDQRTHWLDRASADRLSVDDLRQEMRRATKTTSVAQLDKDDTAIASPTNEPLICPHCGHEIPLPSLLPPHNPASSRMTQ